MSNINKIKDLISKKGHLLADGATGTNLFDMGLESGYPPELWNHEKPDLILSNHKNFINGGSDIILTNSFGANRYRLALHKFEDRVAEINIAAAKIARQAADTSEKEVLVAGSIGPTGEILEPLGMLSFPNAVSAFQEQAEALKDGGSDLLWIETMSSIEEMDAAIKATKGTGLPTICTFSFDTHGKSMMGLEPKELAALANDNYSNVFAYGANCGIGASELIGSIICFSESILNKDQLIVAKGNTGVPKFEGDKIVYEGTPEMMAQYALYAKSLGAKIIGGCCGTTEKHIEAMAAALNENETDSIKINLDTIIKDLGEMTIGNVQMIKSYYDPSISVKKVERRRRRRKRNG